MRLSTLFRLLPLLALPCCQLIKPYQSPLTTTPIEWKNEAQDIPAQAPYADDWKSLPTPPTTNNTFTNETEARKVAIEELNNWWEIFEDPLLNQLEQQAVDLNCNLQATFERVMEARAIVIIQRAALYPNVNFAPIYLRNQSLIPSPIPLTPQAATPGMSPPSAPHTGLPPNIIRFLNSEYALPLTSSTKLTYGIVSTTHTTLPSIVNRLLPKIITMFCYRLRRKWPSTIFNCAISIFKSKYWKIL